jgi:pantetheine-phosphate adenylyltransferase
MSRERNAAPRPGRVAVYPGSFDPIHNGHLDIIERCRPMFDEVVIAVLHNEEKKPLFSVEERVAMIRELVDPLYNRGHGGERLYRVESFTGLLVQFMERIGAHTIVRGLRAVSDFEYEFQMALMNRHLNGGIETVFMMPKEEYSYLSSRLVKEVARYGADLAGLAPPPVLERLRRKFGAGAAGGGEGR